MLQIAQLLTIAWVISCFMEKDTGRVVSHHMEINEKIAVSVAWAWVLYWILELLN